MFNDKGYPHFFRIIPSENEYNAPRLSVLKYFNWTIVGTIYQNEAHYALANNDLVSSLAKNNFTVSASQSFNDELTDQLEIIRGKDIRIILGNFDHTWARHVFCDAYDKNMYGSKYQWLIAGVYPDEWWMEEGGPCPVEHLRTALEGTFVMETTPLSTNKEPTALNIVSIKKVLLVALMTVDILQSDF